MSGLRAEYLEWLSFLQERYSCEEPKHFIPIDHKYAALGIDRRHLKPAGFAFPSSLILDWQSATDSEKIAYREYVGGAIDAAFARRVDMAAHCDLEYERAVFVCCFVQQNHGEMTPYLRGWTSRYTFNTPFHRLVFKDISLDNLGTGGYACWNSDVRGEMQYIPPASVVTSSDVNMAFLKAMQARETQQLEYSAMALADCQIFKLASKARKTEMMQVMRDIHARRLIELVASRKSIPEFWAEQAMAGFPTYSKHQQNVLKPYEVNTTSIKRADWKVWAPTATGKDAHLAARDFSSRAWVAIWMGQVAAKAADKGEATTEVERSRPKAVDISTEKSAEGELTTNGSLGLPDANGHQNGQRNSQSKPRAAVAKGYPYTNHAQDGRNQTWGGDSPLAATTSQDAVADEVAQSPQGQPRLGSAADICKTADSYLIWPESPQADRHRSPDPDVQGMHPERMAMLEQESRNEGGADI